MEIALVLVMGALCISCFITGAKVGQAVSKGDPVQIVPDHYKAVRDRRAEKEAEKEMKRKNTILRNIEMYDGTGQGQEDVP